MLYEKLEKARKESARKKSMLIIGILAVFVVPPILWFSFIGLKTFLKSSGDSSKPVQQTASFKNVQSFDPVVENGHDQITFEKESLSDTEKQDLREQFKSILSQYENQVEPELLQYESWVPEKVFEIKELKQNSLSFFSTGEYSEALRIFEQVQTLASLVITERNNAFKKQLNKAQQYLDNDEVEQSKLHIEKALQIKPGQQVALALLEKIEKLSQIIPLLTAVEVARAENDFSQEYKLLGRIQAIAPDREGITQRRAELELFINEQAFAHHIDKGYEAVEAANPELAVKKYKLAKAIAPKRQETRLLADRIATLERELRISAALKKADQAIRRDDWQTALHAYIEASKDAPQNQAVQEGLTRAKEITTLKKALKIRLADPYQLSDAAAKNGAEKLLKQAQPMGQYSFSLQLKSRELDEKLAFMQQPMAVTVISDKKTYVKVIGLGNVGYVTEKTIRLKPGRYTFEGRRNGYVSKRVKAFIPYDKKAPQVNVICDQPI